MNEKAEWHTHQCCGPRQHQTSETRTQQTDTGEGEVIREMWSKEYKDGEQWGFLLTSERPPHQHWMILVCMCERACVCMCVWGCVYVCVYVYVHVHVYVCTYWGTKIHTDVVDQDRPRPCCAALGVRDREGDGERDDVRGDRRLCLLEGALSPLCPEDAPIRGEEEEGPVELRGACVSGAFGD